MQFPLVRAGNLYLVVTVPVSLIAIRIQVLFINYVFCCVLHRQHLKELIHNNPLQPIQTNSWTVYITSTITESQGNLLGHALNSLSPYWEERWPNAGYSALNSGSNVPRLSPGRGTALCPEQDTLLSVLSA